MDTSNAATGKPRSLAATRPLSGAARFMPTAVALAGLALLAACTSTQSEVETGGAMLPRPQVVIVERFATSPAEVTLDEGLSTEIEQAMKARSGTSRTEQELQAGRQVADAIADKLVVEIQDMGLSAQRGSAVPAGSVCEDTREGPGASLPFRPPAPVTSKDTRTAPTALPAASGLHPSI